MQIKTPLSRIEIEFPSGTVFFRWEKQVLDDKGNMLFSQPHRTAAAVGVPVEQQLAEVDQHLKAMGFETGVDPVDAVKLADLADGARQTFSDKIVASDQTIESQNQPLSAPSK